MPSAPVGSWLFAGSPMLPASIVEPVARPVARKLSPPRLVLKPFSTRLPSAVGGLAGSVSPLSRAAGAACLDDHRLLEHALRGGQHVAAAGGVGALGEAGEVVEHGRRAADHVAEGGAGGRAFVDGGAGVHGEGRGVRQG